MHGGDGGYDLSHNALLLTNTIRRVLLVYPFYAQLLELAAQSVEIQAHFAAAQFLASLLFLGDARLAGLYNFRGVFPGHHDDAVHIADDDVSRLNRGARAYHG